MSNVKRKRQEDVLIPRTHLFDSFCADPGCLSSSPDSKQWLQENLVSFIEFATLQDLRDLNPKISTVRFDCR